MSSKQIHSSITRRDSFSLGSKAKGEECVTYNGGCGGTRSSPLVRDAAAMEALNLDAGSGRKLGKDQEMAFREFKAKQTAEKAQKEWGSPQHQYRIYLCFGQLYSQLCGDVRYKPETCACVWQVGRHEAAGAEL
jgi:hypothetical protein